MNRRPEEPQDIPHLFAEYWNERNAEGIASLFESEAEFVNVVGLWWHNKEDIRKAHDYGLKVIFNNSQLEVRRVKVKELSDTITLVHARMRLSGQTSHDGVKTPGARTNIFSFVVRLSPAGWLCASAHNTDVIPGAETNIIDKDGRMKSTDYRK